MTQTRLVRAGHPSADVPGLQEATTGPSRTAAGTAVIPTAAAAMAGTHSPCSVSWSGFSGITAGDELLPVHDARDIDPPGAGPAEVHGSTEEPHPGRATGYASDLLDDGPAGGRRCPPPSSCAPPSDSTAHGR